MNNIKHKPICVRCGNVIFNRLKSSKYCLECVDIQRIEYDKAYHKKYNEEKKNLYK
jgi:late competence protein required for DNA uptake (superfamily II DNA/RNA helicase)